MGEGIRPREPAEAEGPALAILCRPKAEVANIQEDIPAAEAAEAAVLPEVLTAAHPHPAAAWVQAAAATRTLTAAEEGT
jgi:hypothetical protein